MMKLSTEPGYSRRKLVNGIMLGICGAAAGLAIIILALILGYTVVHGISYLNLDFLESNYCNRQLPAEALGINRTTLYKKMKRLGLEELAVSMGR